MTIGVSSLSSNFLRTKHDNSSVIGSIEMILVASIPIFATMQISEIDILTRV